MTVSEKQIDAAWSKWVVKPGYGYGREAMRASLEAAEAVREAPELVFPDLPTTAELETHMARFAEQVSSQGIQLSRLFLLTAGQMRTLIRAYQRGLHAFQVTKDEWRLATEQARRLAPSYSLGDVLTDLNTELTKRHPAPSPRVVRVDEKLAASLYGALPLSSVASQGEILEALRSVLGESLSPVGEPSYEQLQKSHDLALEQVRELERERDSFLKMVGYDSLSDVELDLLEAGETKPAEAPATDRLDELRARQDKLEKALTSAIDAALCAVEHLFESGQVKMTDGRARWVSESRAKMQSIMCAESGDKNV